MKKIMYAAAFVAALVACTKEQAPVQENEQLNGSESVIATAKDFVTGGATRTVITQSGSDAPAFAWKEGDVIGIIPMNGKTVQSNYEIAEIGSNPKNAVFDGGVWALKEGKEYAAYYPFKKEALVSNESLEFSFLGQTQTANNSLEHLGAYDYMYASAMVPQSGSAQFDFEHKISLVRLQLTVPNADTYTKVQLESSESWFASGASLKLSDGTMTATETVKSATINLNNITVAANGVLTVWFATLPTTALDGQTLNVKLFGNEDTCSGEITRLAALTAGNAYSYPAVLFISGYKSFTAMIASAGKSTLSTEGMISWESGDAISVNGSECTTKTGGTTSVFSADTQVQSLGMVSPRFKAVFPASLETTPGKYVLPSVQPHSSTSVNVPMFAQSNDNNLTFNPMCGLIRVSFTNATSITSVQITMDKSINGEFTIDPDGETVIKSGSTTTTIDCGSGAPATDKFYIPIPAGTYNSLTLTAINEKGIHLNKTATPLSGSLTIRGGTIVNLGTLTFSDFPVPELVDLGLPSGIKWATCNLGANSPEEYGDYYTWGETETYYEEGYAQESPQKHWKSGKSSGYSSDLYRFYKSEYVEGYTDEDGFEHPGHTDSGYTKYIPKSEATSYGFRGFYDNKTVLDPEDDVAHVKLGGKWRMPTRAEFKELIDNCQCDWVNYKGVNGRKFTSKKTGYTDKWIFLPAAGYRNYDNLNGVGSFGYYWSSSLDTDNPYRAYNLLFHSNSVYSNYDYRYYGRSVRPVSE